MDILKVLILLSSWEFIQGLVQNIGQNPYGRYAAMQHPQRLFQVFPGHQQQWSPFYQNLYRTAYGGRQYPQQEKQTQQSTYPGSYYYYQQNSRVARPPNVPLYQPLYQAFPYQRNYQSQNRLASTLNHASGRVNFPAPFIQNDRTKIFQQERQPYNSSTEGAAVNLRNISPLLGGWGPKGKLSFNGLVLSGNNLGSNETYKNLLQENEQHREITNIRRPNIENGRNKMLKQDRQPYNSAERASGKPHNMNLSAKLDGWGAKKNNLSMDLVHGGSKVGSNETYKDVHVKGYEQHGEITDIRGPNIQNGRTKMFQRQPYNSSTQSTLVNLHNIRLSKLGGLGTKKKLSLNPVHDENKVNGNETYKNFKVNKQHRQLTNSLRPKIRNGRAKMFQQERQSYNYSTESASGKIRNMNLSKLDGWGAKKKPSMDLVHGGNNVGSNETYKDLKGNEQHRKIMNVRRPDIQNGRTKIFQCQPYNSSTESASVKILNISLCKSGGLGAKEKLSFDLVHGENNVSISETDTNLKGNEQHGEITNISGFDKAKNGKLSLNQTGLEFDGYHFAFDDKMNLPPENYSSKRKEKKQRLAKKIHLNNRKEILNGDFQLRNDKLEIVSGSSFEDKTLVESNKRDELKKDKMHVDSLKSHNKYVENRTEIHKVPSTHQKLRHLGVKSAEANRVQERAQNSPVLHDQSNLVFNSSGTFQGLQHPSRRLSSNTNSEDTGLSFRLDDLKLLPTNSSARLRVSANISALDNRKLMDSLIEESNSVVNGNVVDYISQGTCGKAYKMTGGGHIEVYTKNLRDRLPKKAMTFATWVRLRRTDRMNTVYSAHGAKGTNQNLEIRSKKPPYGSPNGSIRWMVRISGSYTVFVLQTDDAVPAGIWTHLTAVYNGEEGVAAVYINGVKKLQTKEDKSAISWGTSILLGSLKNTLTGRMAGHLEGDIARSRLFNRQLTSAEITSLATECQFEPGETSYHITVCTGNAFNAGTPSKVFLALTGLKGQFGEIELGSNFDSGCSRIIELHGPDIGEIELLSIRKDKSGFFGKSWYLDKVEITVGNRETGPTFIFPCDCWFKGDKLQHHINSGKQAKGGWSHWSDWSGCGSGMCGGDRRVRTRACTNPVPLNTMGQQCRKADGTFGNFEAQTESCPVDGGWGAWGSWSECSKTCDGALVTRSRKCDNPPPSNNGKICEGKKSETRKDCTRPCNMMPVDGQWSEWSQWSACAQTCGGSPVTRTRSCNNPNPVFGGRECPGNNTETAKDCLSPCPVDGGFGKWSKWGECSQTCGQGVKQRKRSCNKPEPSFGGNNCSGPWSEETPCKVKECPNSVNGSWGAWGRWTVCSEKVFCNQGVMRRSRKCNRPAPKNGGDLCPGLDSDEHVCPSKNCKVEGFDQEDKKKVLPNSFIFLICNANEAFHTQGTHGNEVPQSIYKKYYAAVASSLKSGYFARTIKKQDDQEIALFCFEPGEMPTIEQMEQEFPAFNSVPSLPNYDKPEKQAKVPGIAVGLTPDLSLYSGEFFLGGSQTYTAFNSGESSLSLKNAKFLYQEKPGFRGIVARGTEEIANATFDLEITEGPSAIGSTPNSTNAAEIIRSMVLPTASTFIPSPFTGLGDTAFKVILDHLVQLGLTRVPVTMLTEAASESDGILTRRITGTIATTEGLGLFTMEIIKQVEFAVGFTSTETQFSALTEKLFKKKLNLFGQMREASVGLAFATKNFKVTSATGFSSEPLESAINTQIPGGLFLAAQSRMPANCSQDNFCKLAQLIMGKDAVLYLNGNINLKGFKLAAGIKDRKITESVKLSSVEVYVSTVLDTCD